MVNKGQKIHDSNIPLETTMKKKTIMQ